MAGLRNDDIRDAALGCVERRDEAGPSTSVPAGELPFTRGKGRSRASVDAVMERIGGEPALAVASRPRRASLRLIGLAAAAALIACVSSILTVSYMKAARTVNVRFVLVAPEASSVWLAADFNGWSPEGYELTRLPDGAWEISVPLRKGKSYAYNFVIDGERWVVDPSSPSPLDDGLGGASSSLSL